MRPLACHSSVFSMGEAVQCSRTAETYHCAANSSASSSQLAVLAITPWSWPMISSGLWRTATFNRCPSPLSHWTFNRRPLQLPSRYHLDVTTIVGLQPSIYSIFEHKYTFNWCGANKQWSGWQKTKCKKDVLRGCCQNQHVQWGQEQVRS